MFYIDPTGIVEQHIYCVRTNVIMMHVLYMTPVLDMVARTRHVDDVMCL